MIVERILRNRPGVEHFVHDDEAHAVGQVQEVGRGRVVRGAYRVDAERLQDCEPTLPCAQGHSRAERARVHVKAYALEFEVAAVEPETRLWLEPELAYAERGRLAVESLSI